ncbi:hypothetical protein OAQ84_01740 [Bdellovibrionales bacterium]|nr:hypothetical protein [Bdellovibrionales bacterium]
MVTSGSLHLKSQIQQYLSVGNGQYANKINDLVQATNGTATSICNSDFSEVAKAIAPGGLSGGQSRWSRVQLKQTPIAGSLQVQLTPAESISWTLQGDTIVFSREPAAGSSLQVTYEYSLP